MNKAEATKAGKILLGKMKSKGWTLDVWKVIFGWHYSIKHSNGLRVYPGCPETKQKYHAMLMNTGSGCDSTILPCFPVSSIDPNEVVRLKLKLAREVVDAYNAIVTKAEKDIGINK